MADYDSISFFAMLAAWLTHRPRHNTVFQRTVHHLAVGATTTNPCALPADQIVGVVLHQ